MLEKISAIVVCAIVVAVVVYAVVFLTPRPTDLQVVPSATQEEVRTQVAKVQEWDRDIVFGLLCAVGIFGIPLILLLIGVLIKKPLMCVPGVLVLVSFLGVVLMPEEENPSLEYMARVEKREEEYQQWEKQEDEYQRQQQKEERFRKRYEKE